MYLTYKTEIDIQQTRLENGILSIVQLLNTTENSLKVINGDPQKCYEL